MGFPGGARGKEPACHCWRHKRLRFDSWVGRISWRRAWQPTPVFLPGESHGQRSLAGYSPQGHKETDTTEATQHTGVYVSYILICVSLMINDAFLCTHGPFVCFLQRSIGLNLLSIFNQILFLLLSCKSVLYVPETSRLSHI